MENEKVCEILEYVDIHNSPSSRTIIESLFSLMQENEDYFNALLDYMQTDFMRKLIVLEYQKDVLLPVLKNWMNEETPIMLSFYLKLSGIQW